MEMRLLGLLSTIVTIALLAQVAQCQLSYCTGQPNLNAPQTDAPVFVKQVPNGKLYQVGKGDERFWLVHVWGSAYEMGFAHGSLLTAQIQQFLPAVLEHFIEEAEAEVDKYINDQWAYYVSKYGLEAALDLTYELTREYTPQYFYDELNGIAAATNVSYNMLLQLHMMPELLKAQCSIFGAWNTATPDKHLIQLRALDWDTSGPMQNFPAVVVYHPSNGNGHAFANVGWTGWIGLLTGMSAVQMAISEKVTDHVFGTTSRIGYPFHFLMRDVMQYDENLDAAITRMSNARRTCAIWLGVGDNKLYRANLFQYSYSELVVIDPDTVIDYPSNETKYEHPLIPDVVYWGIHQQCFSALLQQQLGNITQLNTIRNVIPLSQTGDLHAAVYDLTAMTMYVANARGDGETGPLQAYGRPFVFLNMNALFAEKPPMAVLEIDSD